MKSCCKPRRRNEDRLRGPRCLGSQEGRCRLGGFAGGVLGSRFWLGIWSGQLMVGVNDGGGVTCGVLRFDRRVHRMMQRWC